MKVEGSEKLLKSAMSKKQLVIPYYASPSVYIHMYTQKKTSFTAVGYQGVL